MGSWKSSWTERLICIIVFTKTQLSFLLTKVPLLDSWPFILDISFSVCFCVVRTENSLFVDILNIDASINKVFLSNQLSTVYHLYRLPTFLPTYFTS